MKILLVGGSGLLGKKLLETCPPHIKLIPTFNKISVPYKNAIKLDIRDRSAIHKVVTSTNPDLVIHSASLVYVDYCENHKRLARDINVTGTKNLLEEIQKTNIKFFFFSSNGIFDGTQSPYRETDLGNPINVYGATKYAAEQLVIKYCKDQSIIFRLNTMYGWTFPNARENPVTWLLKRLKAGQETYMVDDIYNSHLWVGQATKAVWKAIRKGAYGNLFHIGGADCMNRYTLAKTIAQAFNLNENLIHPVPSSYFHNLAPRPKNTCFDSSKMIRLLGIKPVSVARGLAYMKEKHL